MGAPAVGGGEAEQVTTLSELVLGAELHRSLENVVQHARWRGAPVVVKRVIVSREDSLDKFEDEVRVLSLRELRQCVVTPVAVVRAPPHYSLVLPLMERGSVQSLLPAGGLPLELVLCLAADACAALVAVHAVGLVHRDIKSANILVDARWRAWLTDFGSCAPAAGRAGPVMLTAPSGGFFKRNMDGTTLGYTAPEVLRNTPAVQASDVYGLGMTLAEMLTGVAPYAGMEKEDADMHTVMDASYSEHALILAIVDQQLRPGLVSVSERPGMPFVLIELIRAMWHNDVAARPSAERALLELRAIARQCGVDLAHGAARERVALQLAQQKQQQQEQEHEQQQQQQKQQHSNKVVFDRTAQQVVSEQRTLAGNPSKSTSAMLMERSEGDAYEVHDVATVPLPMQAPGAPALAGQRVRFNSMIPVGAFATSGRRGADKMEDRHAVLHVSLGAGRGELSVYTIFDGHGGAACAHFCNLVLPAAVAGAIAPGGVLEPDAAARAACVQRAFLDTDEAFRKAMPAGDRSGCTAMAVALWQPAGAGSEQVRALVANAGDCRAVLGRAGDKAVRLSRDHNAADPEEQARVRAAGGQVTATRDGKLRVSGHIQVTRALGDFSFKHLGVTAEPEVCELDLCAARGDDFLVVCTDGVFDTLSDHDACMMVRNTAKECGLAAKRVGGEALARGSTDNITSIVCFLKRFDQLTDTEYTDE